MFTNVLPFFIHAVHVKDVRYQVCTVVRMMVTMMSCWVMAPCGLVGRYKNYRFRKTYCPASSWLTMDTVYPSETLVGIYLQMYKASQPGRKRQYAKDVCWYSIDYYSFKLIRKLRPAHLFHEVKCCIYSDTSQV